jgi:hypothetical protein
VSTRLVLSAASLFAVLAAGCSGAPHHPKAHARAPKPPSTNPYLASLAYAQCLRRQGVPQPLPDRRGDFNLTPRQERALRRVPKTRRNAAMKACFHNLAGLNNDPLSARAHRRAIRVLAELKACLHGFGYTVGTPMVRNLSYGRAMFGFTGTGATPLGTRATARRSRVQHICEKRVHMARRLTRIIDEDRRTRHGL